MAKKRSIISAIEENAERLKRIDNHRHDRTITITEFKNISPDILQSMFNREIIDWSDFKRLFIDNQGSLGFRWSNSQGYAGPLKLEGIELQPQLGLELAGLLYKRELKQGDFITDVLKTFLPKLYEYIENENSLIAFHDAKEEFKIPDRESGYGFKFKQNSTRFERRLLEYKYISANGRQHETELGERIYQNLQEEFHIDFIYHTQLEREEQKYKNIDIEGIKIIRTESGDFFEHYAFELKAGNSIQSISESISQAINYKSCSNYAYIVIPNFDYENFYDENRLREYIEMCRQNGIGVISLYMKADKLQEISVILEAPRLERRDHTRVISLLQKKEFMFEKCHLCGRIVNTDNRKDCGWRVSVEGEEVTHCMKLLQQEQTEEYLRVSRAKTNNSKDSTVISDTK